MKKWVAALMLLTLLWACASAETELLAINVGKGDALLLRTDGYTCLIDTGKSKAQDRLEAALERFGAERLDAVFITHTDNDHVGGLKWLRKSGIEIGAVYASKYHPESTEKKHQAVKTADKLGIECVWLEAGMEIPLNGGAVLRVLAPIEEIPEDEDDNSLVMLLESADGRILLTGDMEEAEERMLLSSGAELSCDVLKVPNHGDDDACSRDLIAACSPKIAVISTNSDEKPGTPNPQLLNDLENAGCETYVTQDASLGVYVVLNGGAIRAGLLDD